MYLPRQQMVYSTYFYLARVYCVRLVGKSVVDRCDINKCDETKTPGAFWDWIFHDDSILNSSVLLKILLEFLYMTREEGVMSICAKPCGMFNGRVAYLRQLNNSDLQWIFSWIREVVKSNAIPTCSALQATLPERDLLGVSADSCISVLAHCNDGNADLNELPRL